MNKKSPLRSIYKVLFFCIIVSLLTGCASKPKIPSYNFLQRTPVRVVVLPSVNNTQKPEASIVFNKACEEALKKKGFEVITADQVITYASANGVLIRDLTASEAGKIGREMKADMVLYSDINKWETKYFVIKSTSTVEGVSRLVETSTNSLIWRYGWTLQTQSGGSGNGLVGMLVESAVTAVAHTAFDQCSALGNQAGAFTVSTMPQPGYAPVVKKSK